MGTSTQQGAKEPAQASPLSVLISENASASKWIPHFRNRREAMEHFASVHASRHRLIGVQRTCFMCGGQPAQSVATYRWSARFNKGLSFGGLDAILLVFGHLRVGVRNELVSFNTLHPVCSPCSQRLRIKRVLAGALKILGILLVPLCAVFAGVMWGVFFSAVRAKDRDAGLESALVSTLLFAIGVACLFGARYLGVPSQLRYLASGPFFSSSASFAAVRQ